MRWLLRSHLYSYRTILYVPPWRFCFYTCFLALFLDFLRSFFFKKKNFPPFPSNYGVCTSILAFFHMIFQSCNLYRSFPTVLYGMYLLLFSFIICCTKATTAHHGISGTATGSFLQPPLTSVYGLLSPPHYFSRISGGFLS